MDESKFGMDSPTTPGELICAPWTMRITNTPECIKWEAEAMSGEFLYVTPRAFESGAIVRKGTTIGTAMGPRVRFQITDIDPRLIFKLIEMVGML